MTSAQFIARLGPHADARKNGNGWMVRCPAHDDRNGSLSVGIGDDGRLLLHCHAGCPVESVCQAAGLKLADLMPEPARKSERRIVCTYPYHDEQGKVLFEVVRFDPKDFRQRRPDPAAKDGYAWNMEGVRRVLYHLPEVISAVFSETTVYVVEGEKDADALRAQGFVATTMSGGAKKQGPPNWRPEYTETLRGATEVVILPDKDETGRSHAHRVARFLNGAVASVKVIELPDVDGKPVKDAADYFFAGGEQMDLQELVHASPAWFPMASDGPAETLDSPPEPPARKFTIRTSPELLGMTFDDSDIILGDRLMATGQPLVLAGAGGVGKTRLVFQLAACTITSRKFLIFETYNPELRWLFLQSENSNRRLQAEMRHLHDWLGEDDWLKFSDRVWIHTIETDDDCFLALNNSENIFAIERLLDRTQPDIVVVDPLNDFAVDDLNKDEGMRLTLQTLTRTIRRGHPDRCPLVLHHALTGRVGAAKTTGYDRTSFARNSKVLFAWTRAMINLAPVDPDTNDRLIVACGKNSNGREFQPFAIKLDPDTMIYMVDATVDVAAWQRDIAGPASNAPLISPERVAELCDQPMTRAELTTKILDRYPCHRATAYRYILRAEMARKIKFNKEHEHYIRR